MPGELEFDDDTFMCVDEVSLAESYQPVTDEYISFGDHDYSTHLKKGETFNLTTFLRLCLNSAQEVSRYNDYYFSDFLNPELTYTFSLQGESLPSLYQYRTVPLGNKLLKVPVDLSELVFPSEIPSDFLHIFFSTDTNSVWWPIINVKIQKGIKYTLTQLLYRFVETILAKTQLSFLSGDAEYNKEVEYLNNPDNTIEDMIIEFRQRIAKSSELIKRFINKFIGIVNSVRIQMEIDRGVDETDYIIRKYLFIYCGLVWDTGLQESRSCILCVVPSEPRNFIFINNPNYLKVRDKKVRAVTIAILDERSKPFRFRPSIIPNYISIRFAKLMR